MTLDEKMHELYYELKPKCEKEGLSLAWEVHKAIRMFRKENLDLDEQWSRKAEKIT